MTGAPAFMLDWPGNARFGPGRADELGPLLAARDQRAALIVCDPGIRDAGLLARIEASLTGAGVAAASFCDVEPNPTTDNVAGATAAWHAGRYDALIALGGGSSIDTAKGVMAEIVTGTDAASAYDLADIDAGTGPTPPFYALPTTSGTGSESSLGAVLKSKVRKFVIRGRRLQPRTIIMDPTLTLTLPKRMTAMTGFDAYCHAIGAFANNTVNPVADAMAVEAMRLLLAALPAAVADGSDLKARADVMLGAYLGGFCIGQKGVDGIHGLATPVESLVNATHGEVLGIIMPHMLAYNTATLGARYAEAARRLALAPADASEADAARAMVEASLALKALTGGADRLSAIGIDGAQIPRLTEMSLLSQATARNGRPLDAGAIAELYEAML